MKKWFVVLGVLLIFIGVTPMALAQVDQLFTDQIVEVGNVRRIYFHFHQAGQWHYFGTTAAEAPPPNADPVNEYTYVQFPQAFDNLPIQDSQDVLLELAIIAVKQREGLAGGITQLYTDAFDEQGATKIITFYFELDGEWYYVGSDPVALPPPNGNPVNEVQDIQFPRDFQHLDAFDPDLLYDIGLLAGKQRENIE